MLYAISLPKTVSLYFYDDENVRAEVLFAGKMKSTHSVAVIPTLS
jgi:hypothetical protein